MAFQVNSYLLRFLSISIIILLFGGLISGEIHGNFKVLFGSCFLKLFLRKVFENIGNIILVFFEICFCYLNLVFCRKKKKLSLFYFFSLFLKTDNSFQKYEWNMSVWFLFPKTVFCFK